MPLECYKPELNKIRGLLVGSSKGLTVTEISRKMGINRNSVASTWMSFILLELSK